MKRRLSKILASCGVSSRRASEELIFAGKVTVNGRVIRLPQHLVDETRDSISVSGTQIGPVERKVYFLVHKPARYICTSVEKKMGCKRVLDLFSHLPYRLFCVGRLDIDTTGLLVVTNDGQFAQRLIHPSFNHTKEYLVKTDQEITHDHLLALSSGMRIHDTHVVPHSVKKVRRGTLKIVIGEGKKHEVRLLMEYAQLRVSHLSRIRIGPLILGNLPPGAYRELSPHELSAFMPSPACA
jgi:23S rRNA pseudouridine2605 synthase